MTKVLIADEILLGPPNRRKARRKRVLLSGAIVSNAGEWTQDCTIRQLSIFGAQIAFDTEIIIPDDLFLIDVKHRMAYRAKLAWRQPRLAGLEFRQAFPVDQELPSNLQYLQAALVGRKFRQVDALIAKGMSFEDAIRTADVTAEAYQAWRKECGGDTAELHERLDGLAALNLQVQEQVSALKERVLSERKKS